MADKSVGWFKNEAWEDDQYISLFVVRHRAGSYEGASHQADEARQALDEAGAEVIATTMGRADTSEGAIAAVRAFWGIDG